MVGVSGCSTNRMTEYNTPAPRENDNLLVPPNLSTPELSTEYKMMDISADRSDTYKLDKIKDMHIVQGGSERWLVIHNKTVDQVWPMMVEYLTRQGLMVKYKNQAVGFLQTDWASRNNTVHETGVRSFFDWVSWGSMYSMKSQYMFRINLWQNENDTQVFVTNFQMDEVYPNCIAPKNSKVEISDRQITRWMSVPSNPQLELDFLLHFMMYIGFNPEQVKLEVAKVYSAESVASLATAHLIGNAIVIDDDFDRAWWRTGLALERVGLGVVDKNRTNGEYYVYQLRSQLDNPEEGFWSRWFGSKPNDSLQLPNAQYNVKLVVVDDSHTELSITKSSQNTDSKAIEQIQKYLNQLLKQLK